DGKLRAFDAKTGAALWTFAADDPSKTHGIINWFEGNVALGQDGTLLVPNDNHYFYGVDRDSGTERWHFNAPDQTWSSPAVDSATGNIFVGNNNVVSFYGDNTFALDMKGHQSWSAFVKGSVAASPLITPDGLIVVGAFDGYVHAYDRATGNERWSFGARDHIY